MGPARDNPISGPRTGTTRSEPSAPASAGARGRHNEPGCPPPCVCPAQPPSKAGGASPLGGERHHGVGKANQSTESDRNGRGAAHHAGPLGTPERHAAGHNQGTRTGAKQQRLPCAANPESAHNTQQNTGREQVPCNTSRCPDERVRARRVPSPCRLRTSRRPDGRVRARQRTQPLPATKQPLSGWTSARPEGGLQTPAVRTDHCTPGGYPARAGYEQPPSGWTECGAPQRRLAQATPHTQTTAKHTERAHR